MDDPIKNFKIIGVGTSAGGLEALQNLLSHLSPMMKAHAFIIAQHLSPTYKSMLVQLLGKSSRFPVVEADNEGEVNPGFIYITPPDTEITIEENKFVLRKPHPNAGPKPSIDTLFQSIAETYKSRAVGIILSGTGSDGSLGISSIKKLGGITLAQDPKSAKFDGMPISAIETGHIDYILIPEVMGDQILESITNPHIETTTNQSLGFETSILYQILNSLSKIKGTDFSDYKQTTILRRIEKRIDLLKLTDIVAYWKYLEENAEEYELLFETMLIGVTSFYRDEEAFLSIEEHLEAIIASKQKGDSIRIWAPGCSTGEEAYSIASIIANILQEKVVNYNIQIFATDIDEKSVEFAKRGIYPNTSSNLFKSIHDSSFFIQKMNCFEISKQLKSMVLFTKHDLTRNAPFLKLDMVVCRNLLIYFGQQLQQQIIPIFHYALKQNGILFLGKSESIGNFVDLFTPLDSKNKIYQRKRGGTLQTLRFTAIKPNTSDVIPLMSKDILRKDISISEMVKETIYNTYDFPYVVITDNFSIQMISGDVSLFLSLPEGTMNTNILKMIRPELQVETRFTITKVIRDKEPQKTDMISFSSTGNKYLTVIRVKPLLYSQKNNDLFMVIFEYYADKSKHVSIRSGEGIELHNTEKVEVLEKELATTKEHLQIYIEELESANEELQSLNEEVQSTNEELQSTNEELETSIEELQSTNEEMQIAYTELKSTHEELEKKDKLLKVKESGQTALLNNSLQSFILTDDQFKVLAFNDKAKSTFLIFLQKHIHIGDDILELLNKDFFPLLSEDIPKLKKGEIIYGETSVKNKDLQEIYLAYNFSPVLDLSQNLTVISISLLDISFTKITEVNLRKTENLLKSIFNSVDVGICITDKLGIFVNVNKAYCDIYGYSKEELLGNSFTMVVLPEYKQAIQKMHDLFIGGEEEIPQEWSVQKKDGGVIDISANARLLIEEDGTRYKVTSVRDITERKRYQRLLLETQETAHVGGWEYDLINKSLSMTTEAYHMFGLAENSVQDMESVASLFNEYEKERLLLHFRGSVNNQQPFDILVEFASPTGKKLWYRAIGSPQSYLDHSKKIYGSFQDVTDRINYEIQIKKTSELLEQTNETARVGGWEVNIKTNETHWTKVTREIHEAEEDFKINIEVSIQFYKEGSSRGRFIKHYTDLTENGNPFDDEFEIVTAKNNTRWVRVTGHAAFESGTCVRVYGVFQDIHDRKIATENIRIAKDRYDFLTKATKDAIWDWDINANTLFWGEGFRVLFGYDTENENLNYERWANCIHAEDRDRILGSVSNLIASANENHLDNEYKFIKANGEYAVVRDRSYLIRDESGKPIRMVGAIQDFTKTKEEEHRLKLLESVITNSTDSVLITEAEPFDRPGPRIIYVNQAFTKMTGYTAEEVIGDTPRILQGPKTSLHEIRKLRVAMEKWEACEIQVLNYKKNGEEFWNHFSIFPLANEKGWFTHWIAIEKDITKKKAEEDEKEKLISELTQSNNDLKQFTYITSHNLRAPLSNLSAALNIIDDLPVENPVLSELLKGLRISTNNLNQTVNDLIKILIIKDSPAIDKTELSFQSVYEGVLSQIKNIIESSKAQVTALFQEAPILIFNRSYLESIFLNLLTNAIKYRSPKRELRISLKTTQDDHFIKLDFEDNGLGIDMSQHKEKIFGLYQRFHDLPDSKGLGLYLVKSQVHSLGGTIGVESEIDVGTKFTIHFRR
jgi:two-component system CheB/CheR fusion protein